MSSISFQMIISALTVAAGFSLLVERLVEVLKHIIESGGAEAGKIESGANRVKAAIDFFNQINSNLEGKEKKSAEDVAEAIGQALEASANQEQSKEPTTPDFEEEIDDEDAFEKFSHVTLKRLRPATAADLDWSKLQLFYHLSAVSIGIVVASIMNIHLLSMLMLKNELFVGPNLLTPLQQFYLFMDEILTGLVIAGGSQPIHMLLRFLTTRKPPPELAEALEDQSEEVKVLGAQVTAVNKPVTALQPGAVVTKVALPATAQQDDTGGWVPIEYHGGVKPDSLQNRNFRPRDPDLIVFHHTAMSSDLGFQAIVDEFLVNKGWSTGYHCVIMPNGAIRPFCRWDRVGNHTKGENSHSLGVAFHGNFHTDRNDRFSNHDGSFGIKQPSNEQLVSGARLVALWAHLYDDIELDFQRHILPHRDAKPGHTVCPGSNFPIAEFQHLVRQFYNQWAQSDYAKQQLAEFRQRPYIYREAVSV